MQSAAVCQGITLPEPERDWRQIAGSITRTFNRDRLSNSQPVNYVGYTQYTPYPAYNQSQTQGIYADDVDDGQGNGQGLPE
jgi:hypothetical protein